MFMVKIIYNLIGLCNENNFSTAYDVGKFTYESL